MINSFALYDSLAIVTKLETILNSCEIQEIQMFSYLSCLLSLYKKQPVADWGYSFAGTKHNAPFSKEIEDAINVSVNFGLLSETNHYIQISSRGANEYLRLSLLQQNKNRDRFIDGACSSILAIPIDILKDSMLNEPGLRISKQLDSPRFLLDENNPSLIMLYDQFQILSKSLGQDQVNLIMPAVLWLTFLKNRDGTK